MIWKPHYWQHLRRPDKFMCILLHRWLGVPFPVWLVNTVHQRIFRLNSAAPFQVHFTSTISSADGIVVGRNVWKSFSLSGGCYVQAFNGVVIGDDTIFGPGVRIISANHSDADFNQWDPSPPICIGSRCWIGAGAILLPGVELGDGCIVGAGSVVTKSFPSNSVIVGNPARLLRAREVS